LRSSARYAKAKSKSAINLNAHLKKQQKLEEGHPEKKRQDKKILRQSVSEDQPIYANVDEVIPIHLEPETGTEVDAIMGNAQVSGPKNPGTQLQTTSSICIRLHCIPSNKIPN